MSLAASGGLGGAGGGGGAALMMAHQPNAMRAHAPQAPPAAANTTGTAAPPPSAAALGADLLDKAVVSLKTVQSVAHLPLVGMDWYGTAASMTVASYPKKPEDPSQGVLPRVVTKKTVPTSVVLTASEASHKTLRKYLNRSKPFAAVQKDTLGSGSTKQPQSVILEKPYRWLGLRRWNDAPDFHRNAVVLEEASSSAIGEEVLPGVGHTIANSTLDGSPPKAGKHNEADFDRVVYKVRLDASKKAISVLPEEAVELLVRQAQAATAVQEKLDDTDDKNEIERCPCAVAVPAWASHDAAVEALLDAVGAGGVIVPRTVAALAGALLPKVDGTVTPLLQRLSTVQAAQQKEHQIQLSQDPGARFEDEIVLIVLAVAADGMEATAIQVSSANPNNIACLFGDFKVLANVSYRSEQPLELVERCTRELEAALDTAAPDADGPAGIVLQASTPAEQAKLASTWETVKNAEWTKVPVLVSAPDAVAKGAAVLGAVSHGRVSKLTSGGGGKKVRAALALKVQNVAPVAVAVRMNYHGGAEKKWVHKTLFDFDRQIPAGPHGFELNAAECVVHRSGNFDKLSDEDLVKAIKQNEGAKGIPEREEAALNFSVQIFQKWTRDGEWKPVGDITQPLVNKDVAKDGTETKVACERILWEVSLGVTGMITTSLIGDRQSVVVATKSARNSAIRYYVGIIFAILFFGGFMFKSYYDDFVLERDTKRLLAFYKFTLPGSIHDGDVHNARYTCYKYRSKKAKLWRNLERKYGDKVLSTLEYEEIFANAGAREEEPEEETVDLDDEEASTHEDPKNEAPDL